MAMANHIWVSTVPRTGSMWTFNIVRTLLRESGYEVLPKHVPQSDREMMEIFQTAQKNGVRQNSHYIYKVHNLLNEKPADSQIITILRDPREVAVSFMRFMKAPFADGFATAKRLRRFSDVYESFDPVCLLTLRYEDLVQEPDNVVGQIMRFLGITESADLASAVSDKFRKDRVRKLISTTESELNKKIANREMIPLEDIVYSSEDNVRAYNRETGFQSGHVSEMKKSDYRDHLSQEQMRAITDYFGGWLAAHGYDAEY